MSIATSLPNELFPQDLCSSKFLVLSEKIGKAKWLSLALSSLGVNESNIFQAGTIKEAKKLIENQEPEIIISDYSFDNQAAINIKRLIETDIPLYFKDKFFILISTINSEAVVYQACENEFDAFIIQPTKLLTLKSQIEKAFHKKREPNNYFYSLSIAKYFIENEKEQEAGKVLDITISQAKNTASAYHLLGELYIKRGKGEEALKNFRLGLAINSNHFKCLSSMYRCLTNMGRHEDAYYIYLKIIRYYPIEKDRYIPFFKSAILSLSFIHLIKKADELLLIYGHFNEFQKALSAALYLSGKYFFMQNDQLNACLSFKKALKIKHQNESLLLKITHQYIANELIDDAEEALNYFTSKHEKNKYFSCAKLLILSSSKNNVLVAKEGMRLLGKKIEHHLIYETTIDALINLQKYNLATEISIEMSLKPQSALE